MKTPIKTQAELIAKIQRLLMKGAAFSVTLSEEDFILAVDEATQGFAKETGYDQRKGGT